MLRGGNVARAVGWLQVVGFSLCLRSQLVSGSILHPFGAEESVSKTTAPKTMKRKVKLKTRGKIVMLALNQKKVVLISLLLPCIARAGKSN